LNEVLVNGRAVAPSKVVCIGRNYADHIEELNNAVPDEPVLFIKPNSAVSQRLAAKEGYSTHYEGEIVLCIRGGKPFGVGFGLDLTRREIQTELKKKGLPWERAKSFDGAAVFSEFVAFADNVDRLRMQLFINEKLVQAGGCDHMLYKPQQILDEIAGLFTLEDNDLVMTGTPKGVGELVRGDVFRGEVYVEDTLLLSTSWVVE